MINVTNEGYGRASREDMGTVFGNDPAEASMKDGGKAWYTETFARFEVAAGSHEWLNRTCFVGNLLPPTEPNKVRVEIYEIV